LLRGIIEASDSLGTMASSAGQPWTGGLTGAGKFPDLEWHHLGTSFRPLIYHIAKLEAVRKLMEKLATDLKKQDLTTERELSRVCLLLHKTCSS